MEVWSSLEITEIDPYVVLRSLLLFLNKYDANQFPLVYYILQCLSVCKIMLKSLSSVWVGWQVFFIFLKAASVSSVNIIQFTLPNIYYKYQRNVSENNENKYLFDTTQYMYVFIRIQSRKCLKKPVEIAFFNSFNREIEIFCLLKELILSYCIIRNIWNLLQCAFFFV